MLTAANLAVIPSLPRIPPSHEVVGVHMLAGLVRVKRLAWGGAKTC